MRDCGRLALVAVVVLAACRGDAPPAEAASSLSPLSDGCWALQYGEATAGLPMSDEAALPPTILRIWTDSTFPNSDGLLQVEAAPGFDQPGGGMLSRISVDPDSIELTWAGAASSTHYRLHVSPDSMSGTAWHHGGTEAASQDPRNVWAYPVECPRSAN